MMETNRVMLVGRNYGNLLTMARSLGSAGYETAVLRLLDRRSRRGNLLGRICPEKYSRYVSAYFPCDVGGDRDQIAAALLRHADGAKRTLLLPTDDDAVSAVDANLDALRGSYRIPGVGDEPGAVCQLMGKQEQKRLAAAFGLPVLGGSLIRVENGQYRIPEDVPFPCFVKSNTSVRGVKNRMTACTDRAALQRLLEAYAAQGEAVLLAESFADVAAEYSVLGLSTPEGVVVPGVLRAIEGGNRARKGVALTGVYLPPDAMGTLADTCGRFIQSLGYTGLFDIDLLETTSGERYFVEVNFRPGASIYALTALGINLPGMFADYMLQGRPVDCDRRIRQDGGRFVNEKVLLEEYARRDRNRADVRRCMAEAEVCFIRDRRDPAPYRYFRKYYAVAALMRVAYGLRDRGAK